MFTMFATGRSACIQTIAKVCGKSSYNFCSTLLAPEWSLALYLVFEIPAALQPTHNSEVD